MYQKTILNNGLRLITYAMPRMESAAIGVWVRVGSRYEPDKITGIAHFLEHLTFKGSRKYSCQQIKESIEGMGGLLNGFTSEESTCYLAKLPAAKQFQALDILFDMTLNPLLNQSDVEKEKFVVLEEIKMHRDLPQSHVYDILQQLLWPAHPLGSPILGTDKTIPKLKRDDLISFHKKYYTPSNIVVALCGRLEHRKILKRLDIKKSRRNNPRNLFVPAAGYEPESKVRILEKNTAQTHLALGFYGIERDHRDKHICSLLHIILGANMSSRLFCELREKRGLAYAIGTQVKGFCDTGIFMVHAGVDNAKLKQALNVIIEELDKIKKRPVSLSELRRAKEYYIGQLRLALEDTLDHMFWIGEPTLHLDRIYNFSRILKDVRKVNPDDLRRFARNIFKQAAARLAVIGPLKEEARDLHACIGNL